MTLFFRLVGSEMDRAIALVTSRFSLSGKASTMLLLGQVVKLSVVVPSDERILLLPAYMVKLCWGKEIWV